VGATTLCDKTADASLHPLEPHHGAAIIALTRVSPNQPDLRIIGIFRGYWKQCLAERSVVAFGSGKIDGAWNVSFGSMAT